MVVDVLQGEVGRRHGTGAVEAELSVRNHQEKTQLLRPGVLSPTGARAQHDEQEDLEHLHLVFKLIPYMYLA